MSENNKSKILLIISVLLVITIILVGVYALTTSSYNVDVTTAYVNIDEDAYGETVFDSSKLSFRPILDTPSVSKPTSEDEKKLSNEYYSELVEILDESYEENNVIKIDFKVGGASTNNNDNIIYDIALNDFVVDCALLSPYVKWILIKNPDSEGIIFEGSLDYKTFDTIKDGRLVLTSIQQDLVDYSGNKEVYDKYDFYLWFSDSCQGSLEECTNNTNFDEQVDLFGKSLEGKIEVELYTESKKEVVRETSNTLDPSTCAQNYVVTFNVNGGNSWDDTTCISPAILDNGVCTKNVRYGEAYGTLPTPTKENGIFDGWYESPTSSNKIISSTNVSRLSSHELYARWRNYKVNIKYNVNGGTITGTTRSADGSETYTWTKSSSGIISRSINGAIGTNIIQTIEHGITLNNSGLYNPDDSNYMNISRTYLHVKEGEEWICLGGDCTVGTTYNDSYPYSSNDFCDASTSDCTVELGVNWERNDGVYYAYYEGVDSLDGQYAVILPGQSFGQLPEPSVTNFTFGGWYLDDTYQTEVTSSTVVDSNLSSDITLYAKMDRIKVTVGLEQPDDTVDNIYLKLGDGYYSDSDCTNKITKITVPSKTGYTFNGYSGLTDASGNITASNTAYNTNTTLSASWTANQYTINYYLETTKVGSSTCTYDASCTLLTFTDGLGQTFPYSSSTDTDYGWVFEGWSTSQTSITRAYIDGYTFTAFNLTSNTNLYAVGKRTLRFHSGVAPTTTISTPVQYWNTYSTANTNLSSVAVPAATTISGWSFIGYKGGSNTASSAVDISSSGSQVVPYNIYPNIRSKYKRTLTIAYIANGGSGTTTSTTDTQYYNSGYASTSGLSNQGANVSTHSFTLASNNFTYTGYTFSKWADGSTSGTQYAAGASYSFSPAVDNTTITKNMYAIWKRTTYTISYNANGGSGAPSSQTKTYGTNLTLSATIPTRSGYEFLGWSTSSTATSASYSMRGTYSSNSAATLYAVWKDMTLDTIGSSTQYVRYFGNNGCSGLNRCSGFGESYCENSSYKFSYTGWRIGYIKSSTAYLLSGGATDCLCTPSSGVASITGCTDGDHLPASSLSTHYNNLNAQARKYCNAGFAYGGACNSSSAWNMGPTDFQSITGSGAVGCYEQSTAACGKGNQLIDAGGYYWLTTTFSDYLILDWSPYSKYPGTRNSSRPNGVRPVLRMASNVTVLNGSGTSSSPYRIATASNKMTDLSGNKNHGVAAYVSSIDRTNGTVTIGNGGQFVEMGLNNYNFGSAISLVARIKFNSLPSSGQSFNIIGNWEAAGGGMSYAYDATNGRYFFHEQYVGGSYYNTKYYTNVSTGTWYTVVGTYDGSTVKLYLNGSLVSSLAASGTTTASPAPFMIGNNATNNSVPGSSTNGITFDKVQIYNKTLSASDISSKFSGDLTNIDYGNLLVYYDFKY